MTDRDIYTDRSADRKPHSYIRHIHIQTDIQTKYRDTIDTHRQTYSNAYKETGTQTHGTQHDRHIHNRYKHTHTHRHRHRQGEMHAYIQRQTIQRDIHPRRVKHAEN